MKGIIPGATATVDEVSTTKGAKPPAEGPASSGSACSFSGTYTIRPLYAPCSRKYLSYTYGRACSSKSKSITLRASKQVRPGKHSLNWDLNGTGTVPVVGSELSSCKNRALSAPSKPGKRMKLGAGTWSWRVVPRKAGDCSKVNLYSSKRKGVPGTRLQVSQVFLLLQAKLKGHPLARHQAEVMEDGDRWQQSGICSLPLAKVPPDARIRWHSHALLLLLLLLLLLPLYEISSMAV